MKEYAPIVFIAFNRPDHTEQVLKALAQDPLASSSKLYAFSDAARNREEEPVVAEVRRRIHRQRGFLSVECIERSENFGCSRSVLTAVETVLALHGRCIVLEDDVLPYPLFLRYMNQFLDVYADDPTVFSIGAYSHPFDLPVGYKQQTFLLNRSCSWGWATWQRAWNCISTDPQSLHQGMQDPCIRKQFARDCGEDVLRTYQNASDIWDLRLCFQQWKHKLNTVFPIQPMVRNIGRDGSGTHYHATARRSRDKNNAPVQLPEAIRLSQIDPALMRSYYKPFHKSFLRKAAVFVSRKMCLYNFLLKHLEV